MAPGIGKSSKMNRSLALHHFTVLDLSPLELIPVAAEAGCDSVCVFVEAPEGAPFWVIAPGDLPTFSRLLDEYGVRVANLDFFSLEPEADFDRYRGKLALGAQLGARRAIALIDDGHFPRALDSLCRFAEMAGEFDLSVGLEFMGLTPACADLPKALSFVEQANMRNLGIAVDVLHAHLTGATPEGVRAVHPDFISHAQLCDTAQPYSPELAADPDRYLPLAFERLAPGEGIIPIAEYIDALPDDVDFDVEAPSPDYASRGLTPLEHARQAVEGARRLLPSF